jgi:hypothetical protein
MAKPPLSTENASAFYFPMLIGKQQKNSTKKFSTNYLRNVPKRHYFVDVFTVQSLTLLVAH